MKALLALDCPETSCSRRLPRGNGRHGGGLQSGV